MHVHVVIYMYNVEAVFVLKIYSQACSILNLQVKLGDLTLSDRARQKLIELASDCYNEAIDTIRLVGKRWEDVTL